MEEPKDYHVNVTPTFQLCDGKFSMYFVPQEREAYDGILDLWPKIPPLESWLVVSVGDAVIVRFMRTGQCIKDIFLSKSAYRVDYDFAQGETQDRFYGETLKPLVEAFLKKWLNGYLWANTIIVDDKLGKSIDINLALKVENI
jgi:hypothetical protein